MLVETNEDVRGEESYSYITWFAGVIFCSAESSSWYNNGTGRLLVLHAFRIIANFSFLTIEGNSTDLAAPVTTDLFIRFVIHQRWCAYHLHREHLREMMRAI